MFKIWRRQRQRRRHKSMIWLVELSKIVVLHVRHAFWCNVLTLSAKRRREIFIFEILTTTRARSSKSFSLCLSMKTVRTTQAKVQFAYFVQRDQHMNHRKILNLTQSSILLWRFRCSSRRSFLNSLFTSLHTSVEIWHRNSFHNEDRNSCYLVILV